MPDYGHTLEFGTFLTPVNDPPEQAVQLAQLSEQLGFDLVTFQDHPYQPAFHDTWTLLTWVAARTERIRLSANVHNIPLRQPAVLARAAASLDLLSGGRFELAIGAGGFWDAIEAMGGGRLTGPQSVTALEQAIEVIHGIWDVDTRGPLRAGGEFHAVNGAKRGPAPAHDMPIWVGAKGPRMLRIIARSADGWLPSFGWLGRDGLREGNATIDAEAVRVGRDPREVRRLLNVGADVSADELADMAIQDGVGTFILATDDPRTLASFAADVIPTVRAAVDEHRAQQGTPTGRVRSAKALAERRDGIDYDGVPDGIEAVEPGDSGYGRLRNNYLRGGAPGLVMLPDGVSQVRDALAFARRQPVALGVRSGGHGISGRSTNDGGIVLDLRKLDGIEVLDEATRRVRIEPGARWIQVARELHRHGWALTSGDYGGVAVGGIATAGGIGWFAREHGLTIDHLRAVDLVTASGETVRASADENPELFWGMRGAGFEFGIATAFEFEADETGDVGFAQLQFAVDDVAGLIERYGTTVEGSPREVSASLILNRGGQATLLAVVDSDDPDRVVELLQPLAELAPLTGQSATILSYPDLMGSYYQSGPHHGEGEPHSRSGLVEHLTPEFARDAAAFLESGATHFFQFRSAGGAVSDVAEDATAYAGRSAEFSLAALSGRQEQLDRAWDALRPHLTGAYVSFDTGKDAATRELVWPAAHLERLRALKREWDPDGVFADNIGLGG